MMTKQVSQTIKAQIARFKLLKRIEKRLGDKLDVLRKSIMDTANNQPCIFLHGDEKLASVIAVPRKGIDTKALALDCPELAEVYETLTESIQLRCH